MNGSVRKRSSEESSTTPKRREAKGGKTRAVDGAVKSAESGGNGSSLTAAVTAPAGKRRAKAKRQPAAGHAAKKAQAHELQSLIAETAYFSAEREGFPPGRELEHWLQAERLVLERFQND